MIEEIPSGRISAENYVHLKDTVEQAGVDAIILPGGGHEALEKYLTCDYGSGWKCGKFVCYKHNPELRPEAGETAFKIPSPEGNVWSNEIPEPRKASVALTRLKAKGIVSHRKRKWELSDPVLGTWYRARRRGRLDATG